MSHLAIVASPAEPCRNPEPVNPRKATRYLKQAVTFTLLSFLFTFVPKLLAQDNYEIQVYPSETVAPGTLLTELHSNYTVEGSTTTQFGMLPTQGQEHETIELTQGLNKWSEVGFYIFTEEKNGTGIQWVGDHIRPRVREVKKKS